MLWAYDLPYDLTRKKSPFLYDPYGFTAFYPQGPPPFFNPPRPRTAKQNMPETRHFKGTQG